MSSKAGAQEFVLGPFTGGLNEAEGSDRASIADNELTTCNNLEVTLDGTLRGRPPIEVGEYTSASTTENMRIIGSGYFGSSVYIFGSNASGTWFSTGRYINWTLISANLKSKCALQYRDRMWIIPQEGSSVGGNYNPATSTWTADSSMPYGEAAIFHKSRLFVVVGAGHTANYGSRMTFSEPITSDTITWDAADFVDVSPGDGQKLIDIIVYNDHLMLFKEDSTYVFAYDIFPADAVLRIVNERIGARGWKCVVQHDNVVYVYHNAQVYEVVNYQWDRIDLKINIKGNSTAGTFDSFQNQFITLFGDRLLVRYYNTVYCFGLLTRTWSKWRFNFTQIGYFGPLQLVVDPTVNYNYYFAGGISPTDPQIMYFADFYSTDFMEWDSETGLTYDIDYILVTKTYDLDTSADYKKLKYWTAEFTADSDVHTDILGATQAIDGGTTAVSPQHTDVYTLTTETNQTKYTLMFRGGFRFKQVYFQLSVDGNGAGNPPLFGRIRAIVGLKQTATQEVN